MAMTITDCDIRFKMAVFLNEEFVEKKRHNSLMHPHCCDVKILCGIFLWIIEMKWSKHS